MPEHAEPLQYPKTPKLTPWNVAIGMPLTIGVEMTESRRRMKETKSNIVKGVAGLSMTAKASSRVSAAYPRPDLARKERVGGSAEVRP